MWMNHPLQNHQNLSNYGSNENSVNYDWVAIRDTVKMIVPPSIIMCIFEDNKWWNTLARTVIHAALVQVLKYPIVEHSQNAIQHMYHTRWQLDWLS